MFYNCVGINCSLTDHNNFVDSKINFVEVYDTFEVGMAFMDFIYKGNQRWALFDKTCIRWLSRKWKWLEALWKWFFASKIFACLASKFTFKSSIIFSTSWIIFSMHTFWKDFFQGSYLSFRGSWLCYYMLQTSKGELCRQFYR